MAVPCRLQAPFQPGQLVAHQENSEAPDFPGNFPECHAATSTPVSLVGIVPHDFLQGVRLLCFPILLARPVSHDSLQKGGKCKVFKQGKLLSLTKLGLC